jgi:PhzF family phenazine biosynthesis protein
VRRPFTQVDVFGETSLSGNPVAVVLDGDGLSTEQMQRAARWANLSETTFVLPPSRPRADYRVRIFTPTTELPFAGHPTLGTCHAWSTRAGAGPAGDRIVQECAAGLVPIRRSADGLAFAAPPLIRDGPVAVDELDGVASALGIGRDDIIDAQWVDNGPGWVGILLADADAVLRLRPGTVASPVGVVGPHPAGSERAFEVRAFFPSTGGTAEDPVTGSLNASLAQWLVATGRAHPPYRVGQGTAVGAAGVVRIDADPDGTVWVGGRTVTVVAGTVEL